MNITQKSLRIYQYIFIFFIFTLAIGSLLFFSYNAYLLIKALVSHSQVIFLNKGSIYLLGVSLGSGFLTYWCIRDVMNVPISQKHNQNATSIGIGVIILLLILPHLVHYLVDNYAKARGKSGTLGWSNVKTKWTNIDPKKYPWVCNAHDLVGKTVELEVVGTMFGAGKADIKMTVIDDDGEHKSLVSKMNIESKGFQLTGLKVRGILKRSPGARKLVCE